MRSALVDVGKRKSLLAVANKTGLTRECNSQTILGAKEWMSPFQESYFLFTHGLGTPNESFYHQNSKLLGLGRQFEQMNFWAFGVFLADLSAPFLVLRVPCPCFPLIKIPDTNLGLGFEIEFGLQRIWDLAIVCP